MLRETKGSVMPDLTLEQVREAGRFAFLHWGAVWGRTVYVPGVGVVDVGLEDGADGCIRVRMSDDPPKPEGGPDNLGNPNLVLYLWHHLPGCTCEFCS